MNITSIDSLLGVIPQEDDNRGSVDSSDFTNLLTTQLKNQDPFEPVSDAEFLGQLAQFSSLEESQNQTQALKDLTATLTANASLQSLSQASGLIGKEISFFDNDGTPLRSKVNGVEFASGGIRLVTDNGFTVPMGLVAGISEAADAADDVEVTQNNG